jgi:hypothetical protein
MIFFILSLKYNTHTIFETHAAEQIFLFSFKIINFTKKFETYPVCLFSTSNKLWWEILNLLNLNSFRCGRTVVRKDLLSRINQIYYWGSFFTTHEHYNYLQLINLIKAENYFQKIIKGPDKLSVGHW